MTDVYKGQDITGLLQDWKAGNQQALEKLSSIVQKRLQNLASSYLRREEYQSLQSSDLVNQAYVSLISGHMLAWEDRAHFFGILARLMRQLLIQHARKRVAQKRVGRDKLSSLEEGRIQVPSKPAEFILLDEALQVLESIDPRQCGIVEMRYFGGLTIEETAVAMGCSESTVVREWRLAKAWLYRELKSRRSK